MTSIHTLLKPGNNFKAGLGDLVIRKFIGKGKSGYSYLADFDNSKVVLKVMHNEINPFYKFSRNKVDLEIDAFNRLNQIGIRIPYLIESNPKENYLVKNYIEGYTASQVIAAEGIRDEVLFQLFEMSNLVEAEGLNIDFFPSNFVIDETQNLFYIDYEVNPFIENWSLKNWGLFYWANSNGFKNFLKTNDASFINSDLSNGIPIKKPFEEKISLWINKFNSISH
jgi:TP53 regulating kinase-like protein